LIVSAFKNEANKHESFKEIAFKDRFYRVLSTPYAYQQIQGYSVKVATDVTSMMELLNSRLITRLIGIGLSLVIFIFLGWFVAQRILKPVNEITAVTKKISHEDLHSRVKTEHLDAEIRNLAGSFNEMLSRLEQAFQYISDFSSHVSHELKNAFTVIKGEAEIGLLKDRDVEEYRNILRTNLEQTDRMIKTVEDLLLLTRLTYRPEAFVFENLDLVPFLVELLEDCRLKASEKKVDITVTLPEKQIYVMADKQHLRRLFTILLNNALNFSEQGDSIEITADNIENDVAISVADTGSGIDKKDLDRIMARFFHGHGTDQEIGKPWGLGLSIAQSVARLHHGTIKAESEKGKGSKFTVVLPVLPLSENT
jgi:signal transduction histidine kinase